MHYNEMDFEGRSSDKTHIVSESGVDRTCGSRRIGGRLRWFNDHNNNVAKDYALDNPVEHGRRECKHS
jgi:hypothetical protein